MQAGDLADTRHADGRDRRPLKRQPRQVRQLVEVSKRLVVDIGAHEIERLQSVQLGQPVESSRRNLGVDQIQYFETADSGQLLHRFVSYPITPQQYLPRFRQVGEQ